MFATNSEFSNDFIFSTHCRRPQTMNCVTTNNSYKDLRMRKFEFGEKTTKYNFEISYC